MLRQHKLGEADRIVTLLTRDHGLVPRGRQRGVRRTRSKFGSQLEPFAHIDVQLHPAAISTSSPRWSPSTPSPPTSSTTTGATPAPAPVLETAERLAGEEHARRPALHRLTVGALRAVADGKRPRELVLDAYLLRHGHRRVGAVADRMRAVRGARPASGLPTSPPVAACACTAGRPARPPRRRRSWTDVGAARRRLGGRGVLLGVHRSHASGGGRSPAMAPGTPAADLPLVERVYRQPTDRGEGCSGRMCAMAMNRVSSSWRG